MGREGERERERERERASVHTHTGERKRVRERERKSARTRERESVRKHFGSSFYMFFPPPGPALCKLGLARSVFVLPEVFTLVLRPSFDPPCLLASAILDSFSLFYLPNNANLKNAIIIIICVKVPFDCKLFIWIPYIHTL